MKDGKGFQERWEEVSRKDRKRCPERMRKGVQEGREEVSR